MLAAPPRPRRFGCSLGALTTAGCVPYQHLISSFGSYRPLRSGGSLYRPHAGHTAPWPRLPWGSGRQPQDTPAAASLEDTRADPDVIAFPHQQAPVQVLRRQAWTQGCGRCVVSSRSPGPLGPAMPLSAKHTFLRKGPGVRRRPARRTGLSAVARPLNAQCVTGQQEAHPGRHPEAEQGCPAKGPRREWLGGGPSGWRPFPPHTLRRAPPLRSSPHRQASRSGSLAGAGGGSAAPLQPRGAGAGPGPGSPCDPASTVSARGRRTAKTRTESRRATAAATGFPRLKPVRRCARWSCEDWRVPSPTHSTRSEAGPRAHSGLSCLSHLTFR